MILSYAVLVPTSTPLTANALSCPTKRRSDHLDEMLGAVHRFARGVYCLDVDVGAVVRILAEQYPCQGVENGCLSRTVVAYDRGITAVEIERYVAQSFEIAQGN